VCDDDILDKLEIGPKEPILFLQKLKKNIPNALNIIIKAYKT
jgi:hypothetical protein